MTDRIITSGEKGEEGALIPAIPNDVAINILARIPRLHHPTLSLVSKSFRSVIDSQLLYSTRSLIGSTRPFLYVCIRVPTLTPSILWFIIHLTAGSIPKPAPLPSAPNTLIGSAYASVGPKIYVIGGSTADLPTHTVYSLDCRTHTWESAPRMRVAREFAAAGNVDGKVYVIGGCVADTRTRSRHWAEVFEPETGEWSPVDSTEEVAVKEKWMHASAVVNGKIFAMADRSGVAYEPRKGRWEIVTGNLDLGWRGRACVVNGVLYCYDYLGKIRGYDAEGEEWKVLQGVDDKLPRFLCGATLTDSGGNLVVIWEAKGSGNDTLIIGAEIEIRNEEEEIWGNVLWCNSFLTLPSRSSILHCLSVIL